KAILEGLREAEEREAVCYICSGGEYTDIDKIVFCERCSVALHESCYNAQNVRG
ncbi:unnamed protein product, partial [Laminaria digitata]